MTVTRTPGMNHCSNPSSPATDLYDALTPLMNRVENGMPPDSRVAKARANSP
jgi:hypothetical protein